jgi:hypothetical protein
MDDDLDLTAEYPICPGMSRSLSVDWAVAAGGEWLIVERWRCGSCHCHDSLMREVEGLPWATWNMLQDGLKAGVVEIVEIEELEDSE